MYMLRENFFLYILASAGVTYLIRMLPMVLVKGKIKNRFILSFLCYVPYAVLSVMTIPAIFSSTGNTLSAVIGFIVAVILAYFERSLVQVALFSSLAVFVAETVMRFV